MVSQCISSKRVFTIFKTTKMDPIIFPFPGFICPTMNAIIILLEVLELASASTPLCPPFPAEYIATSIIMFIQVLAATNNIPIRVAIRTLFPTFRRRRELWSQLAEDPVQFWELTGETPESLTNVILRISNDVETYIRNPRNPRPRYRRTRPFVLSVRDRVLMLFVWLRTYPTFAHLGSMFGVSGTTAAENIHVVLLITLVHYQRYISWHSQRIWNTVRGTISDFPDVVGMIDATPIRINRPQGNLQRLYYRRDRGCHFLNWQVIIDSHGYFTYGQAGFLGHLTDSGSFAMMPQIGHNSPLSLPRNAYLMADSGYPMGYPLLVPFSRRGGRRRTVAMQLYNRLLSRYRVHVEHCIGELKIYRCVSGRFRHRRWRISCVANIVMALTNRRRRTIINLRSRM